MTDSAALEVRLREIADDPAWPDWYRVDAKCWGAEGLEPASLADDDIREALQARMLTRPKPDGPPMTREGLDAWLAKQQAADDQRVERG